MIITFLLFIPVLGILVFVHELGHFLSAKSSGMKVDEFGFGFPPRIFGLQKIGKKFKFIFGHKDPLDVSKTVYSINWIPLGGFVKIVGENNEGHSDPQSFVNKSFSKRLLTLAAGVIMNVILAWVLLSFGYMVGLPVAVDNLNSLPKGSHLSSAQTAVVEVMPETPADKAGLKPNDVILTIDGQNFATSEDLRSYVLTNAGKTFVFQVQRGKENLNIDVNSKQVSGENQGPTGIVLAQVGKLSFPWYLSFWEGAKTTVSELVQIVTGLASLFTSGKGLSSLGGPIKIASLTRQVAEMGFVYLLQFTAFLSLNLAILNVLPIPALDGGRIMFLIIEKIRGKANNPKFEQTVNVVGFLSLITLMLVVSLNDIFKFF